MVEYKVALRKIFQRWKPIDLIKLIEEPDYH